MKPSCQVPVTTFHQVTGCACSYRASGHGRQCPGQPHLQCWELALHGSTFRQLCMPRGGAHSTHWLRLCVPDCSLYKPRSQFLRRSGAATRLPQPQERTRVAFYSFSATRVSSHTASTFPSTPGHKSSLLEIDRKDTWERESLHMCGS